MNSDDEILISSYFDDELSEEEIAYVENLIAKDPEASSFLNNIKSTNIELRDFFSDANLTPFKKEVSDKFYKQKNGILGIFKKPLTWIVAAISAPLFFLAPVGFIADNNIENINNPNLFLEKEKDFLEQYPPTKLKRAVKDTKDSECLNLEFIEDENISEDIKCPEKLDLD